MEVSKINNVSFKCLHNKNKEFQVSPNNGVKHKNRTGLILLGLAATGAIAAAILVKKHKFSNINIPEKLQPVSSKEAPAVEKAVEAVSEPIDKIQAQAPTVEDTTHKATATLFDEMQTVNSNPPAAKIVEKDSIQIAQESQKAVEAETAPVVEKTTKEKRTGNRLCSRF